jgi:hypothetical protein
MIVAVTMIVVVLGTAVVIVVALVMVMPAAISPAFGIERDLDMGHRCA